MKQMSKLAPVIAVSMLLAFSLASIALYALDNGAEKREGGETLGLPTDLTGYKPIHTVQDLAKVGSTGATTGDWPLNGNYYLANDIMFVSNSINHTPIGSQSTPFTGKFDGNGHVILGMNVAISDSTSQVYGGLFGYISGAQVSNLGMMNGSVHVSSSSPSFIRAGAGGIAGYATGSTITNCYNTISITASTTTPSSYGTHAGGIVGYVAASTTISNSYNTGIINAYVSSPSSTVAYASAGGIAGCAYAGSGFVTINNCYNTGSISASSYSLYPNAYVGGIVGDADSMSQITITSCYNIGSITASSTLSEESSTVWALVGGIIGNANASYSGKITITSCYNTGPVSITSSPGNSHKVAGGIAGTAKTDNGGLEITITNCYNAGSVVASSSYISDSGLAGGIVGYTSSGSSDPSINPINCGPIRMTNCYNAGSVASSTSGSAISGGIVGLQNSFFLSITNCYNIGSITASSPLGGLNQRAGGIVGNGSGMNITNCYFLQGTAAEMITGGVATLDGTSTPARKTSSPDQRSGVKADAVMKTTLVNAQASGGGDSIYYSGTTSVADALGSVSSVSGWDFYNTWTIIAGVNDGYPILRSFVESNVAFTLYPLDQTVNAGETAVFSTSAVTAPNMQPLYQWSASTNGGNSWQDINGANGMSYAYGPATTGDDGKMFKVMVTSPMYNSTPISKIVELHVLSFKTLTGTVTSGSSGLAGVTITYTGGSTTTDAQGNYTISGLPHGSIISITGVTKSGYAVNESMPPAFTMTENKVQNFTIQSNSSGNTNSGESPGGSGIDRTLIAIAAAAIIGIGAVAYFFFIRKP